jgi:hypothetical protein
MAGGVLGTEASFLMYPAIALLWLCGALSHAPTASAEVS